MLPGANWPIEITEALNNSRCVLVFWSLTSINFRIHHWIREEAEAGRKKIFLFLCFLMLLIYQLDSVMFRLRIYLIGGGKLLIWNSRNL